MYEKIGYYKDKKNFGNQIVIYKGENNYLVIIKDRDEISYYFVDNNITNLYPMNSYMKKIGFIYDFNVFESQIKNCFDLELSKYGYSACPDHLKNLIKSINKSE